jgi:phage gp16-like protein
MTDRRTDLAKIHLAKKQLGLDDDAYRDMLWVAARVRSASELDEYGRRSVIEHLRKCGATFRRAKRPRPAADRAPLLGKIYAMLGDRPAGYAEGILKRMYGEAAPARLEWASQEQLRKVVAALNYDKRRNG